MFRPRLLDICLVSFVFFISCQGVEWQDTKTSKRNNEKWETVGTKASALLEAKYQELSEKARQQSVIQFLAASDLQVFLFDSPRNYSTILLVSNDPKHKDYKGASGSLRSAARDYKRQLGSRTSEIFFIETRYDVAPGIFRKIGYEPTDVSIFHISQYGGLKNVEKMNRFEYDYDYQSVIRWLRNEVGIYIRHFVQQESPIHFETFAYVLLILCILYKNRNRFKTLYESDLRNIAGVIVIVLVLLCTSGQIFNHIQQVPFALNQHGYYYFFYPSTRYQIGFESYLIFALSIGNAMGLLLVIENGRLRHLEEKQNGVLWGLGLFGSTFFSIMLMSRLKMNH